MEDDGFTSVTSKQSRKMEKKKEKIKKYPFIPKMTEEYRKALEMFPNKDYKTFDIDDLEKVAKVYNVNLWCNCCQDMLYHKWCKKLNMRYSIVECRGCHCCIGEDFF
jgi:threonyl-tRNA synthetase